MSFMQELTCILNWVGPVGLPPALLKQLLLGLERERVGRLGPGGKNVQNALGPMG